MITYAAILGSGLLFGTLPSAMQGVPPPPIAITCIDQFDSNTLVGLPAILTFNGNSEGCSATANVLRTTTGVTTKNAAAGFQYQVATAADAPWSSLKVKFHRYWAISGQAFVTGSPLWSELNFVSSTADAGAGYQGNIAVSQQEEDQYASFPAIPPIPAEIVAGQLDDLVINVPLTVQGGSKVGTFFVTTTMLFAKVTISSDPDAYSRPWMWGDAQATWNAPIFYVGP